MRAGRLNIAAAAALAALSLAGCDKRYAGSSYRLLARCSDVSHVVLVDGQGRRWAGYETIIGDLRPENPIAPEAKLEDVCR